MKIHIHVHACKSAILSGIPSNNGRGKKGSSRGGNHLKIETSGKTLGSECCPNEILSTPLCYDVFQVRDDVVRADDDTPDVISVQHTRSLRQMWTQIERDRDKPQERPPPLVKAKEPSPEPPKPPPEEPKPRFGRRPIGRLHGFGQLQKDESAPAGPTKPGDGRGVRGGKVAAATAAVTAQHPAQESETKTSKLYVKPMKPVQKYK